MTTRNNDHKKDTNNNINLSEDAATMRRKDASPEERSEAARHMGHASGGSHSHTNSHGGGRHKKEDNDESK